MIVPGFSNRYPKGDDDYLWSYADCNPRPDDPVIPGSDRDVMPGPDRASLLIETCCTTLDQALAAQSRGAGRIELCADLSVGGLTPPRDLIREAVASLTIPVNVLIRPEMRAMRSGGNGSQTHATLGTVRGRGPSIAWEGSSGARRFGSHCHPNATSAESLGFSMADFVYDEAALQQMMDDIAFCKSVGAAGKSVFMSLSRQVLFMIPLLLVLPPLSDLDGVWVVFPISDAVAFAVAVVLIILQFRKINALEQKKSQKIVAN